MNAMQGESIEIAAILKDNKIYTGFRHDRIITGHPLNSPKVQFFKNCVQGFMTNFGRFVDRYEGAKIAFKAGQTEKDQEMLMSEDLW